LRKFGVGHLQSRNADFFSGVREKKPKYQSVTMIIIMPNVVYRQQTNIYNLLLHWLSQQISHETLTWLEQTTEQITHQTIFQTFSLTPHHIGKQPLQLSPKDRQAVADMEDGWCPSHWRVDQTARTLLVLALAEKYPDKYQQILEQLFTTADLEELIALYQALPLLPDPEKLQNRAAEGVRSNITTVFDAIALRNPYPARYFSNAAWNQIVLKALHLGRPLHLISGLQLRVNKDLSKKLINYAHERHSAHRPIPAQIWQLVEP
jgi:hypothetical protein